MLKLLQPKTFILGISVTIICLSIPRNSTTNIHRNVLAESKDI